MAVKPLDFVIVGVMFILTLWINTQFGLLAGQEQITNTADFYTIMAFAAIVGAGFAWKKVAFFDFIGLGADGQKLGLFLGLGAALGFLSFINFSSFITPQVPASLSGELAAEVFVKVVAPFVETYFFVMLMAIFEKYLSSNLKQSILVSAAVGIILSSALFAAWHLVSYQGDLASLQTLFLWSVAHKVIVRLTGSIAPELGSHVVLNLVKG